jgi:hypothetical protein
MTNSILWLLALITAGLAIALGSGVHVDVQGMGGWNSARIYIQWLFSTGEYFEGTAISLYFAMPAIMALACFMIVAYLWRRIRAEQ